MIKVNGLRLVLNKTCILDNISLELEDGKIHGLIGRNGSGKTMLMKCICGFIRSNEGTVVIDDKVVGKDMDFPESLGLIIETPGFIGEYSGYRNLKLLADIKKKIGKKEVIEAIEKVGLNPKSRKPVRKYSLGMRQRLALAQAIMESPKLLVLDEPFNGLDKEGLAEMREYLLKLKEEKVTIIIASHSSEDIALLCDDIHEMENGRIVD